MNSLDDYNIHEHLPDSLAKQNIIELAKVIDEQLHEINALSELALVYPRIDELTEEFIDELAVQFHVDFYSSTLPIEKKRALVKNSIAWHMRKGTASVVQEMAATVFDSADVQEWFEYGGDPYFFRVMILGSGMTEDGIEQIIRLINAVKNVRSWLDEIGFYIPMDANLYGGFAPTMHKHFTIYPAQIQDSDLTAGLYGGFAPNIHKSFVVYPEATHGAVVPSTQYVTGGADVHKRVEVRLKYVGDSDIEAVLSSGFVSDLHKKISIKPEEVI